MVIEGLNKRKIAFIEVNEAINLTGASDTADREKVFGDKEFKTLRAYLKPKFNGAYIANFGFNRDTANAAIENGEADLVSFGNLFCQNSNLVEKFEKNIAPTFNFPPNVWILYFSPGALGYTDLTPYENPQPATEEAQH